MIRLPKWTGKPAMLTDAQIRERQARADRLAGLLEAMKSAPVADIVKAISQASHREDWTIGHVQTTIAALIEARARLEGRG
jgi:hypothetical protein